jgi:hypothetical protein
MLHYVRYVYFIKEKRIIRENPVFSSERIFRKDYDCKCSTEKKRILVTNHIRKVAQAPTIKSVE